MFSLAKMSVTTKTLHSMYLHVNVWCFSDGNFNWLLNCVCCAHTKCHIFQLFLHIFDRPPHKNSIQTERRKMREKKTLNETVVMWYDNFIVRSVCHWCKLSSKSFVCCVFFFWLKMINLLGCIEIKNCCLCILRRKSWCNAS